MRSVALQLPTVIVLAEGKPPATKSGPGHLRSLIAEYYKGSELAQCEDPTNSCFLVDEGASAYPNWTILASDGTSELSTATA